ncbi:thiol peroxidase [Propionibacterium sp.]|uniref:thiol peroxidase n=1 Tax=Propionibacterium sp. TaxID=1977903 RepID=UPI0039EAACDA
MATTAFKGNPVHTSGELPPVGSQAPDFTLVGVDLDDVSLSSFGGQRVVLNIFPSLDTSTCARSVRKFNELAADLDNTTVVCISKDLPFAANRFCTTEGIENVITGSAFRSHAFAKDYGVRMSDGPLEGLFARSVVVVDEKGKVLYAEFAPEISEEPDYDAALAVLG